MAYLRKITIKQQTFKPKFRSIYPRASLAPKILEKKKVKTYGLRTMMAAYSLKDKIATDAYLKKQTPTIKTSYIVGRSYWVAEESYREGKKVKSRVLFSFSKHIEGKPTRAKIKVLLDRLKDSYLIFKSMAEAKNLKLDDLGTIPSVTNYKKLKHAYSKLYKSSVKPAPRFKHS